MRTGELAVPHGRKGAGGPDNGGLAMVGSTIAIAGGTLIDGRGGEPLAQGALLVESGRIAFAGSMTDAHLSGAELVVDAEGATILPGLIDCHLHLAGILHPDPVAWMLESGRQQAIVAAADAQALLSAGVTTVCEVSRNGIHLRRLIDHGYITGPKVLPCGPGISRTGGFNADYEGFPAQMVRDGHPYATLADGPDGVRRAVRELLRDGSECIKVWATGPMERRRTRDTGVELTPEELRVIVDEAAAWGVPVQAHCESRQGGRNAVSAGVRLVIHGDLLDDETLIAMAEASVSLAPTLAISTQEGADPYDYGALLPPAEALTGDGETRGGPELVLDAFHRARDHGVPIALGSDTYCRGVMPYGDSTLRELRMFVQAGLTPLEALTAGTRNSARALGIDDETGTLESGKCADVVVVKGDVTANIEAFTRDAVLAVISHGRLVAGSLAAATS
jgi:imidazolonepropionase-like amidohydrolase